MMHFPASLDGAETNVQRPLLSLYCANGRGVFIGGNNRSMHRGNFIDGAPCARLISRKCTVYTQSFLVYVIVSFNFLFIVYSFRAAAQLDVTEIV